ncbi:hypothetical protein AB0E69_14100 [Kribbella sp. NPDC026611]|uniref:hypothetical protein n=1 Tax=Kribbella sp. NPDC026611 TaxID=3154911 RepID=UPI0034004E17
MIKTLTTATFILLLAGCTTPRADPSPTPSAATPSATTPSATASPTPSSTYTVPRTTVTPSPKAFRYQLADFQTALPSNYDVHRLRDTSRPYPPPTNWKRREDPLAGHQVSPEACRDVIRYSGVPGVPGDFVTPNTPQAAVLGYLHPEVGDFDSAVSVTIVELAGPLGDRLLDQRLPTPLACAHIQIDGKPQASVVERPLPGYGVRSRYIVRTYPFHGKPFTERTLHYRTANYVVLIRLNDYNSPERHFMAFAEQTRDRLRAELKS